MNGIYRRPTVIAGVALVLVMAVTESLRRSCRPMTPMRGTLTRGSALRRRVSGAARATSWELITLAATC